MSVLRNMLLCAGAALALAACAGSNAGPAPAAPAPPPPPMADAPAPGAAAGVAAPGVAAPPAGAPPRQGAGDIVVPGGAERQVQPPAGDPRSDSERMQDIRAWDRCVTRAQSMGESDPMRPQLDSPEELCSRQLGMSGRTAVPDSRRP